MSDTEEATADPAYWPDEENKIPIFDKKVCLDLRPHFPKEGGISMPELKFPSTKKPQPEKYLSFKDFRYKITRGRAVGSMTLENINIMILILGYDKDYPDYCTRLIENYPL